VTSSIPTGGTSPPEDTVRGTIATGEREQAGDDGLQDERRRDERVAECRL
jgi:hypothetical protein